MITHSTLAEIRHDVAGLRADLAAVREAATAGRSLVADRLISLRQRVTDLRAGADDQSGEQPRPDLAPLLPWLAQQVDVMIGELSVREFTDAGAVDPRRHEVVELRPTAVPGQAGLIADTLGCGFLIGSELLRRQRVVAFVAAERTLP